MKVNSDWRDGFLFVGNHLLLDFLNTRPVMDGEAVEMLPDARALARWLAAAGLVNELESAGLIRRWSAPEFGEAMEAIRQFRERAREAVLKIEAGDSIGAGALRHLNRLLVTYPYVGEIVQSDAGLERRHHFTPEVPEHSYAPLANAFADLLT